MKFCITRKNGNPIEIYHTPMLLERDRETDALVFIHFPYSDIMARIFLYDFNVYVDTSDPSFTSLTVESSKHVDSKIIRGFLTGKDEEKIPFLLVKD